MDTASPDFIGPLKPAYLTVNRSQMEKIATRLPTLRDVLAEGCIGISIREEDVGRHHSWEVSQLPLRLTFRDDYAAAEFALRYA